MNDLGKCYWTPSEFLDSRKNQLKYAVIVLNRPINVKSDVMVSLWNRALVRITVDGGTKCWHQFVTDGGPKSKPVENVSPHIICGDFDSLPKTVLEHFPKAQIKSTPDQDETDFTKSLGALAGYLSENNLKIDGVIAVCDSSGRFDQIVANINTLYKAPSILGTTPLFLMGDNSLTWLLSSGEHVIDLSEDLQKKQPWCGLLPFGHPAQSVTTTGLVWNLDHGQMEFGKLVSTSNKLSGEPRVTVQTDTALVWSMGLGYIAD